MHGFGGFETTYPPPGTVHLSLMPSGKEGALVGLEIGAAGHL